MGEVPKQAEKLRLSRRKLMVLAGGSTGAAAFLAACGGDDVAAGDVSDFGDGDIGALNYLLTLEYVEAGFYAAALEAGLDEPESKTTLASTTLRKFGEEETEHVTALTKAVERLDGDPAEEPETEFPLETYESMLALAGRLENLGAAAYLSQIPKIENSAALATVLSIHSVEGRHAATVNEALGEPITPDGAFAKPASDETVLKAIEPFIAG